MGRTVGATEARVPSNGGPIVRSGTAVSGGQIEVRGTDKHVKLLAVQAILFVNRSTGSFITCAGQLADSAIKLVASIIDACSV